VLFLYQHIDDFVMKNMEQFNKRRLVSIESANRTSHPLVCGRQPSNPGSEWIACVVRWLW
jgi:hypothetical protein